nr:hypothetical protein [Tanacetum cinerariifolium]
MAPKKRTTRASPATKTTTTTPVTNAQLKELIDQGVADATVGHDVAYAMTWTSLEKKTTDKYCPKGEIKKMEVEMWNMKVKESNKIEKYVGGLPDMIHESVMASKAKTMQDAVEFATELMDKKIPTFAERQTKIKSKQNDNQQQENKRQNTGKANTAALERRIHMGDLSNCALNATITAMVQVLPNATSATELAIWPVTVELKNQNHGNQAGGTRVRGMAHALGGGKTNQDLNNMEDDINA